MNEISEKIVIRRYIYRMFAAVLLLGGMMFLISSCDRAEDVADGDNTAVVAPPTGEPVVVNFTIGELGFGENEVAVRSATPSIPETAVIPITGELSLYATLTEEETPVKLRATVPLFEDSKVRIIAYWGPRSVETYMNHADYEVLAGGVLNPVASPLTLSPGTYRFVAYSFHNAMDMDALTDITDFIAFQDVLWGDTVAMIGTGNSVHIRVHHLFSQVKIEAHLGATAGNLIDGMTGAYVSTFKPRLIVKNGMLILDPPTDPIGTIPVTWSTSTSAKPWISELHYVHTRGSTPFLQINSVTVDGVERVGPYHLQYPATTLAAGKSYILRLRFVKDDVNTTAARLTWDPVTGRYAITRDPKNAGLYFKFGSVVGIFSGRSATGTGNIRTLPGTTTATAFAATDIAWNPTGATTWASIPSYASTDWPKQIISDPADPSKDYHNPANVKAGKGDPCRLVGLSLERISATPAEGLMIDNIDNGAWRLPTLAENAAFAASTSGSAHWWNLLGGTNPSVFGSGVAGGEFPTRNSDNGSPEPSKFLPAAGYRHPSSPSAGAVAAQNESGDYWSNAPASSSNGFSLSFDNNNVYSPGASGYPYGYGFTVRCIQDPFYYITVERVGYTYGSYLLDGSQYTLTVRSNTAWLIRSISGITYDPSGTIPSHSPMLDLQPADNLALYASGTGDPVNGEPVTFTVVKQKATWGSMTIVFGSPTGLFADYTVTIMFAIRRVKIMGIGGTDDTYAYNVAHLGTLTGSTQTGYNSAQRMLTTPANFGYSLNSKICAQGFDYVAIAPPNSSAGTITNLINTHQPDIIVISYPTTISQNNANEFRDYVINQGGVLIALLENTGYGILARTVMGDPTITYGTAGGAGAVYSITNVDDEITNGPFGDIRNQHWGEDASTTTRIGNLPPNVTIYSYAVNVNGATNIGWPNTTNPDAVAFRWHDYPFVYVGDGGFLSAARNSSYTICPFQLDPATYWPIPKLYGASTTRRHYVYNSTFFANIMAWAITQIRD